MKNSTFFFLLKILSISIHLCCVFTIPTQAMFLYRISIVASPVFGLILCGWLLLVPLTLNNHGKEKYRSIMFLVTMAYLIYCLSLCKGLIIYDSQNDQWLGITKRGTIKHDVQSATICIWAFMRFLTAPALYYLLEFATAFVYKKTSLKIEPATTADLDKK